MRRYRVTLTEPAERDIRDNRAWWSENRSQEQATRWLVGIRRAILSLDKEAERFPLADERSLSAQGLRQMDYCVGRVATHRVLYQIIDGVAVVYRVRSTRQDAVGPDDLA